MKKLIFTAFAAVILCGCTDSKPVLYVYNWMDYVDPEVIAEFERENGCHVVIDGFDDNEQAISKLLAGGGGYDLVFPSSYVIGTMERAGLIRKLDKSRLDTVFENFDRRYERHLLSTNMEWSVPYAFSMTGYAYRSDKAPPGETFSSWLSITNRALNGRVCMLNDMREIIGIGLRLNGFSVNSTNRTEIACAAVTMKNLKKYASKLDNIQYKSGLVSAEFYLGMGYNSDVGQIMQEDQSSPVRFVVPSEGSTCCFDEIVIMKDAKHEDLAYRFINYLYRPEVAAKNAVYICTAVPNSGMLPLLGEEDRKTVTVSEDTLNRLELIKDVGSALEAYNRAWDEFKSNRD